MSQKRKKTAERESLVIEALNGINSGKYNSPYEAAKKLEINASTVYSRLNGRLSRSEARIRQQFLTEAEEQLLLRYIKQLTKCGYPLSYKTLRQLAVRIHTRRVQKKIDIQHLEFEVNILGKNWVPRFIERHLRHQICYWTSHRGKENVCCDKRRVGRMV